MERKFAIPKFLFGIANCLSMISSFLCLMFVFYWIIKLCEIIRKKGNYISTSY